MPDFDFKTATSGDLIAYKKTLKRDEVDPDLWDDLVILIADKRGEERMAGFGVKQEFKTKSKKFDKKAHSMWPELKDDKSEFAVAVNAYLEEMGTGETDALALFNAANAVGHDLGLTAAGTPGGGAGGIAKIKPGSDDSGEGENTSNEFVTSTKKVAHGLRDLVDTSKPEVRDRLQSFADAREEEGAQ